MDFVKAPTSIFKNKSDKIKNKLGVSIFKAEMEILTDKLLKPQHFMVDALLKNEENIRDHDTGSKAHSNPTSTTH